MRIAIFGAGAIGGYLAAMLADAGHAVSVVARGANLQALKTSGLRLETASGTKTSRPKASDDPAELGEQDYVLVTVKGPALAVAARQIKPLLGRDTPVIAVMNGIPWWFFDGFGGPHDGKRLKSTDPEGAISAALDPARIIGGIAHVGASVPAPGVVKLAAGNWFILGEPQARHSARLKKLADAMVQAGFKCDVSARIQQDVWMKYLGNMSMNPVSVLTGGTLIEIATEPGTRQLTYDLMVEADAVGRKFGLDPGIALEARIKLAEEIGHFKTSMLQDYEARRPMEIDTFLGVALEMAALVGVPVPKIEAVHALLVQKARLAGLYPKP